MSMPLPFSDFSGLAKRESPLLSALAISAALHALILSIVFVHAPKVNLKFEPTLTAILVNTSTSKAPAKPRHIAQANLDGGGLLEAENDPSSPSEKSPVFIDARGENERAKSAEEKVRKLEIETRRLLAAARSSLVLPAGDPGNSEESAKERKARLALAARIDRDLVAYATRPKKSFLGASAVSSDAAVWAEAWQRRIEAMGNQFYPEAARGKIRGALILTAGISKDGSIESSSIEKSSGSKVLDDAALRILRLSSPFEPFPPELRKKVDILYITRQWRFGPDGSILMSAPPSP